MLTEKNKSVDEHMLEFGINKVKNNMGSTSKINQFNGA